MALNVLNVAFPFAPVGEDAVGGAEQVVAQLDRALVANGDRSLVIACAGSRVAGRLIELPAPPASIGETAREAMHRTMRRAIARALRDERIDVLHFHGLDHPAYLPSAGPPALVTLHLPLGWYAPGALHPTRPRTWLQPVSASQVSAAGAVVLLVLRAHEEHVLVHQGVAELGDVDGSAYGLHRGHAASVVSGGPGGPAYC